MTARGRNGACPTVRRSRPARPEMTAIRPYREADEARSSRLWQDCGLTRPWNPPAADIALRAVSAHGEILLARRTTAASSAASWSAMTGIAAGSITSLSRPSCQQRGVGRRLMRGRRAMARARAGCASVELMIRNTNTEAAAAFYARLGYDRGTGDGDEPLARRHQR